jgi:hypothetical protein
VCAKGKKILHGTFLNKPGDIVPNETSYCTDEEIQKTLRNVHSSVVKTWLGGKMLSDFGMRTSSLMKVVQTVWVNGTFMDWIVQFVQKVTGAQWQLVMTKMGKKPLILFYGFSKYIILRN